MAHPYLLFSSRVCVCVCVCVCVWRTWSSRTSIRCLSDSWMRVAVPWWSCREKIQRWRSSWRKGEERKWQMTKEKVITCDCGSGGRALVHRSEDRWLDLWPLWSTCRKYRCRALCASFCHRCTNVCGWVGDLCCKALWVVGNAGEVLNKNSPFAHLFQNEWDPSGQQIMISFINS